MNFVGFNTTNASKNDIVAQLQVAFEQEEIKIFNDEKQIRELSYYAATYNMKTKTLTFNAPNGLNDDICIALMLSWNALKLNKGNFVHIRIPGIKRNTDD